MENIKIKKICVKASATILEVFKQMDKTSFRLLIVMNNSKFISLISIGDLQRAIINNISLNSRIQLILRKTVEVASTGDDYEKIKKHMLHSKTEFMPVIDDKSNLEDVIFWEDVFNENPINSVKLDLPVVIMAGGRGTRLHPLTNMIPKPLIPIDNKTISEHIIDNFHKVGCHEFYFSINYKASMIKSYFDEIEKDYCVSFFEEAKPLGTAGSLHLLNGLIRKTFFISNCDILIEEDYSEIYNYHVKYKNELTIIAAFRHYAIPYGKLETGKNGELIKLQEKPELNLLVNSGMYILEPHLIEEIPRHTFFHITDLIEKIKKRTGRIGVFPVSEKAWIDIGTWENYLFEINKRQASDKTNFKKN